MLKYLKLSAECTWTTWNGNVKNGFDVVNGQTLWLIWIHMMICDSQQSFPLKLNVSVTNVHVHCRNMHVFTMQWSLFWTFWQAVFTLFLSILRSALVWYPLKDESPIVCIWKKCVLQNREQKSISIFTFVKEYSRYCISFTFCLRSCLSFSFCFSIKYPF